jgi:hypothetical protein
MPITNQFSPNYKPPFDTGKVRIGLAYTKPQKNYIRTEEDEFWQGVLLGKRDGLFVGPVPITWYVVGLCVLFLLVVWVVR